MIGEEKLGEGEDDAYSIDEAHNNRQEFDDHENRLKPKQIKTMKDP